MVARTMIFAPAILLIAGIQSACSADLDFRGNWKVILSTPGQAITLWLVRVDTKDGKPHGEILSALPQFARSKMLSVRTEGEGLHLTLSANATDFSVDAYAPKGEDKPSRLLGSASFRGQREFAILERTDLQKLDSEIKNLVVPEPDKDELEKAAGLGEQAQQEALEAVWKKHPGGPLGHMVGMNLLFRKVRKNADQTEVQSLAEQISKQAALYGPEMEIMASQSLAGLMLGNEKLRSLALAEARQAFKLLPKSAPLELQAAVLKLLVKALRKNGEADEAKDTRARLAKVDTLLDEQYLKNAIPFKPQKPAVPKNKSERIVLVELFTGAECPPCVAADVAFDALVETFTSAEVALIQYHLHVPGPDPLTNLDSEARAAFYQVEGTPGFYIDGNAGPPAGGPRQSSQGAYRTLLDKIAEARETKPNAQLSLRVDHKGNDVSIHADVSDINDPAESVRLRFALVEDVVRYPGGNGQRFHHHIVRGFPGGAAGLALKEKSAQRDVTISIPNLRKDLQGYLVKHHFDEDNRPLDLDSLTIVAFIQNDKTKEVLQAASASLGKMNHQKH